MSFRPKHLSTSAVQLFARCPAAYKRRYIDRVYDPPSPAMAFGSIFANALEALHRGYDAETELVKIHAATVKAGQPVRPGADYGLRLLAKYREHGVYAGEPERRFRVHLPDRTLVPVPIVGYMDLMTADDVVEVKTSQATWTQARCDAEYQAAVYRYAFARLNNRKAECVRYLVFGTISPTLTVIETRPGPDELRSFEAAAVAMLRGIDEGRFEPMCGNCAACPEREKAEAEGGPELVFGGAE